MNYYQKDYYKRKKRLEKRHEIFAERILELGNIAAGALVFGNFLSESINWSRAVSGLAFIVFIYIFVWYNISRFKN